MHYEHEQFKTIALKNNASESIFIVTTEAFHSFRLVYENYDTGEYREEWITDEAEQEIYKRLFAS